jgi:hypothetical protein
MSSVTSSSGHNLVTSRLAGRPFDSDEPDDEGEGMYHSRSSCARHQFVLESKYQCRRQCSNSSKLISNADNKAVRQGHECGRTLSQVDAILQNNCSTIEELNVGTPPANEQLNPAILP